MRYTCKNRLLETREEKFPGTRPGFAGARGWSCVMNTNVRPPNAGASIDAWAVGVLLSASEDSGGSRICKRGAKAERRRREYRGAEGVWVGGVPLPNGGGALPPPQKIFRFGV